MSRYKYKVLREYLHVQQYFDGFILKWQELPVRFFQLVIDSLGSKLNVQTGELTVSSANVLSDVRARYSIYGGPSSVSLMADRLAFDFPGLSAADLPLVYEIMGTLHDKLPEAFPEIKLGRAEVQDHSHLDLGRQESVYGFLSRYAVNDFDAAFSDAPSQVLLYPKFTATSSAGDWKCDVIVDRSIMASTAIFGTINTTLLKAAEGATFLDKAGIVQGLTQRCLTALDLEIDLGSSQ